MATTTDGSAVFSPPMPDFSNYNLFSTAGDMKVHLQSLLDNKEKQLQQAGTLGQRVLAQQMELEERIRQLQELELEKSDDDEVDPLARDKYRELAETLISWDSENAQLSSAFGNSKRLANGKTPSPSVPFTELPREEPERSKPSASSAAQSRRAKNAAHRADDVEFAFEIGSGLLTEVRRLQSLLAERDKAIQDMKEEKDDLEKTVETLRTALRQQEQNADKYREENWNLEVTLQELRAQLTDSQSTAQRLEGEHKRLNKTVGQLRESSDQHKNESERLANVIEEMKAKHETDVAQARKTAAGLNRDKADLQQTIDTLKKEVARAGRRLPRFGSPLTPNGPGGSEFGTPAVNEDGMGDVFTAASTNRKKFDANAVFGPEGEFSPELDSPETSPIRSTFLSPNHPSNEIETLQQRLAHAQRQINTLKATLAREKQQKIDYRNKLEAASPNVAATQGTDDEAEPEEDDDDTAELAPSARKGASRRGGTPFKVGASKRGRGRGGRTGITLMQRLGMAAHSPASIYNNDDDQDRETSPSRRISAIPIKFSTASEDEDNIFASKRSSIDQDRSDSEDQHEDVPRERSPSRSPSPLESAGNRTSVDGMDPAFANVLRRNGSSGSAYARSPLRQSILGTANRGRRVVGRRARGGAAFKEARPASIVAAPDVLSEELLGMSDSPMRSQNILEEVEDVKEVETAEFGCQTDFEEPVVPAPEPKPETSEIAVQAEVIEEPVVVPSPPAPIMVEQSMQTDEEPKVVVPVPELATQSTQTDEEPEIITPTSEMGVQYVYDEPIKALPPVPVHADMSVGTEPQLTSDADTQTTPAKPSALMRDLGVGMSPLAYIRDRRTTITQVDRSVSSSTGDETITGVGRSFLAGQAESDDEIDEGDETETGAETETDTDDYTDARQSISMMTPSAIESQDDFHSMMTVTDNEFPSSDDEDTQSIKASQMSRSANASRSSVDQPRRVRPSSFYANGQSTPSTPSVQVEYEEVGVSADFKPEPERIVEKVIETVIEKVTVVEPAPKPEVREMSIQTDEWKPPPAPVFTPPPTAVAPKPVPASPTFSRVGSAAAPQFQFIAPPPPAPSQTPTPTPPVLTPPGPLANIFKEPTATTLTRSRTSPSDRRQSLESSLASKADEVPLRTRVGSAATMLTVIDKSKPPTMAVPPPPKLPPPPNAMPPPAFIPERRLPTTSTGSFDGPPGRPSSPPPAELIQRATTPTFGSIRTLPGSGRPSLHFRQSGSSMPPEAVLQQQQSRSSFRSGANANNAQTLMSPPGRFGRRDTSQISLVSERSLHSPRSSVSSDHMFRTGRIPEPTTPERNADTSARNLSTTDPAVIHSITQTMIGEWVYKYTRSLVKGHGSRHKRFFWVHPYTRTLYWSSADPGSSNVSESSAKSAYIEGVRSVLDPNPMPPGLHQYSLIISTPQREMKITCPTQERHDIWHNALKYLLARANNPPVATPGPSGTIRSPMSQEFMTDDERREPMGSPQSQKSNRSVRDMNTWAATPRGQRSRSQLSVPGSIGKRSNTPALEYLRWNNVPDSPDTPSKSFVKVPSNPEEKDDDENLDFELHGEGMSDEYEGLENVRACCDGRHTVGPTGKHVHHHNHPHQHQHQQHNQHLDPAREAVPTRPLSPSTWSFRSRSGSTHSHEGGSIFPWGRGEDGKLRFGSRRSARTVPTTDQ